MAPGFPFSDRRQRPRVVVDVAAAFSHQAADTHGPHRNALGVEDVPSPQNRLEPAGESIPDRPHVDIECMPGDRLHREVLG